MSTYCNRWCQLHGDWDMDVENQCRLCNAISNVEFLKKQRNDLEHQIGELTMQLSHAQARLEITESNAKQLESQLATRCGCQFHNSKPVIECGYHQGTSLLP